MTDIYFRMITAFWLKYFEKPGLERDSFKVHFLKRLQGYLPVQQLIYAENPFNVILDREDGLVSITQISDTPEALFPEKLGDHDLLTVEHWNGCWTALYAVTMEVEQ